MSNPDSNFLNPFLSN